MKNDGFDNEYLFVLPDDWLAQITHHALYRFLVVTDIGYFPKARHHYRERTEGCAATILLYCSDGEGFISLNGQPQQPILSGQAMLIPPGIPHSYGASLKRPWSIYWVHLGGEMIAPYLKLTGENQPPAIPYPYENDITYLFRKCFEILKAPYQMEEYFLLCQSVGSILAHLAVAAHKARSPLTQKEGKTIEECISLMKAKLNETLTLGQLSKHTGYSVSYLNRLFKQGTGHAPIAYFLRMKISAASKDIYFSTSSIKAIALDYGIVDPYYFSRLFKKHMGLSPALYRRQNIG